MVNVLQKGTRGFFKFSLLLLFFLISSGNSYGLDTTPPSKEVFLGEQNVSAVMDKAGEQVEHPGFPASVNISGYLVYLPEDYYQNPGKKFPLVIFLHGTGEKGNNLSLVRRIALPKMVDDGKDFPFIMISPQSPHSGWSHGSLDVLVDMAFEDYRVDANRLYITGLSMGGAGTWNYTTYFADRVAAAVPICGWGPVNDAYRMKNVPVWATHNQGDNVVGVDGTINMVNALENAGAKPNPVEIIYPVSGHDAWTATYNDQKMWDWLLAQSKNGSAPPPPANKAPTANAGADKTIKLPENSLTLTGSGADSDGSISSYLWSKTSGPNATMNDSNKPSLKLTNLVEGAYVFRLTVTDDDGAKAYDDVKVTVSPSDTGRPPSSDNGLLYTYYEGTFNALPDFSKLKSIASGYVGNFDLSPRKRNDYYAFTFEGKIEITTTGEYTFYTNSDDGSKLYINGKQVVNNDGLHGNQERSGKISLSAGKHDIKVTFFEKNYGETLGVKYAGPGIAKQAIPSSKLFKPETESTPTPAPPSSSENGLLYSYYEGTFKSLPDFSKLTKVSSGYVNNFDLSPRKRNDFYAFSFDGKIKIETSGEYTFYTNSDDGSKLYINGKEVVNNDGLHGNQEKSGKIHLNSGLQDIKVTFFEHNYGETLGVKYSGPGISKQAIPAAKLFRPGATPTPSTVENGLTYKYYEGTFNKLPDFSKLKAISTGHVKNFDLSPRKRNDYFAFTFEGKIEIVSSGEYTFFTNSDDGSKLYINGKQVVDNDGLHGNQERSGKITLSSGLHDIKVTFFEKDYGETLGVKYAGPGIGKQAIPSSKLFRGESSTSSTSFAGSTLVQTEQTEIDLQPELARVYPNPVVDELNIDLTSNAGGEARILLIDLSGKAIGTYNQQLVEGSNLITLDLQSLNIKEGVFILKIILADGSVLNHKLIKK